MVAKITLPASIKKALNYNEQKLKEGKAVCIYAHQFLKEAEKLNFYEKLQRFEALIALNKRASTNTVHISLNFGLNEKMEKEKLAGIACLYMYKIGFDEQPYLVYQHLDAGHPHIHIVSTNIKKDGKESPYTTWAVTNPHRQEKKLKTLTALLKLRSKKKSYTKRSNH